MTLTKKMAIGVLGLLTLICIGNYLITFNNARHYFYAQLKTNARDTAISLGLSLSHAISKEDKATMLSMVEAVFDSGYFSSIEVKDTHGNVLVSRRSNPAKIAAPKWFIQVVYRPNKVQSSLVMDGWRQIGEVSVLSNPNYAYKTLWINALELMKSYVFFAFVALLGVYLFIHWLLQPLNRLKNQALAIRNYEFPIEKKIPKTLELKEVTLAMNQMVKKLKTIFNYQIKQIDTLRKAAYQDPLTGLANRQFFIQQLDSLVNNEDFSPGFVLVVALDGLYELYKQGLHEKADNLVIDVAKSCIAHWPTLSSRISGNNFAILIHDRDLESFNKAFSAFHHHLRSLEDKNKEVKIILGKVGYTINQSTSSLLSDIDKTIQKSRGKTSSLEDDGLKKLVMDISILESALKNNQLDRYSQKVVDGKSHVFHEEVYVRLVNEKNKEITAGYFMPLAEKEHIAHKIDDYVLFNTIEKNCKGDRVFAFNLSLDTLLNPKHSKLILKKLANYPLSKRHCIHIELNESLILNHFSQANAFFQELKKLEVKTGIDQVGLHFSSLYYLNELSIAYVKLNGSLIQDLNNNQDKAFFPYYFYEITKTLGIEIIATQIEKLDQWTTLQSMSIHWGQGNCLAETKKL